MEKNKLPIKDLLIAYKVITKIMNENGMTHDTSFRRVQTWISNAVCDNMEDEEI